MFLSGCLDWLLQMNHIYLYFKYQITLADVTLPPLCRVTNLAGLLLEGFSSATLTVSNTSSGY